MNVIVNGKELTHTYVYLYLISTNSYICPDSKILAKTTTLSMVKQKLVEENIKKV